MAPQPCARLPATAQERVYVYQALFRDSQASAGLGLTYALHVDFCQ